MPKTSNGDTVICVGRESIESLASGEPVRVGEGEYLLQADSYDYPYRRIAELEAALNIIALRLPDQTLSEPVDWQEVANTFVSVARNALDGAKRLQAPKTPESSNG